MNSAPSDTDRSRNGAPTIDSAAGWVTVAAAFASMFAVFAVHYSFGSFFSAMAEDFNSGSATTAFFFALTNFLYFLGSVFTGRACDRFGPRPVVLLGAAGMAFGLLATSFVSQLWLGFITYGVGVGTAAACGYVPLVAVVGGWFEKKRALALGVAVAGIGAGTLVGAPLTEWLIGDHGWRVTFRILAVGASTIMVIVALVAKAPPHVSTQGRPTGVWATVRNHRGFWTLWFSTFFIALALFLPFVFMSDYIDDREIDGSAGLLIGILGVASVAGRMGLGAVASRMSVVRLYQASTLLLGLSYLIWLGAGGSYTMLVVYTLVMGTAYGGFIALSPSVAAETFGPVGLGGILGAVYTAAGFGGLLGPPMLGLLIDEFDYRITLIVATVIGVLGSLILIRLTPARQSRLATR